MSEGAPEFCRDAAPAEAAPSSAPAAAVHAPVAPEERIAIVDVLRGFALLGILAVNMQFYTTPFSKFMAVDSFWSEPHDVWATFCIRFFAQSKFYTLFSFLFGLGISIQLLRAQAKGRPFLGYHYRRMLVLLLIGLFHAFFIWMGDILVTYALLGCILPLFLRCQPRTLFIWAAVILFGLIAVFLVGTGLMVLGSFFDDAPPGLPGSEEAREQVRLAVENEIATYARGGFWEITGLRAWQTLSAYVFLIFYQGPHSLVMFLLGLAVGKSGWFQNLPASLFWFRRAWLFGLIVGLGGTILVEWLQSQATTDTLSGLSWKFGAGAATLLTAPALSCFYASTLVILYQYPTVRAVLNPLTAVGQMALTNYLAQSLICTTLFYGSTILFGLGFGFYASLGPAVGIGLTLLIWLVEVVWSNLWLRTLSMRFGPMEWVWRTLTYWKIQPMR